jgi:hypothetical protein
MKKSLFEMMAGAAFILAGVSAAQALPVQQDLGSELPITQVAGGCGPGAWRGPWGHCRNTPYSGRLPNGWYQINGNGCPPGFWRGPWGHCRNTRYHGRRPDGGWQ